MCSHMFLNIGLGPKVMYLLGAIVRITNRTEDDMLNVGIGATNLGFFNSIDDIGTKLGLGGTCTLQPWNGVKVGIEPNSMCL